MSSFSTVPIPSKPWCASAPRKSPKPAVTGERSKIRIDVCDILVLHQPERVELVPGAAEALVRLQAQGLRLAIVTNQQGIGLGYFSTDDFIAVNQAVLRQLAGHGIKISKIYYCPHSLAESCQCRKPGTRLLERALNDFGISPNRAFVVGDTAADSGAARALGVPALQIREQDPLSWDATASAIENVTSTW